MTKITYADLLASFSDNVYEGVKHAQSFHAEYPEKPAKPVLKKEHTSADVEIYNKEYKIYESLLSGYNIQQDAYRKRNNEIDAEIEKYLKEVSGFNRLRYISDHKVVQKMLAAGAKQVLKM